MERTNIATPDIKLITSINKLFKKKREKIDHFIENEYTSSLVEEYIKLISKDVDINTELSNIIKEIISIANEKRNEMQNLLEKEKVKAINQMLKSWNSKNDFKLN